LALDGLSHYKYNIEFGDQHLPTGDLPYEGRLFKDALDGIHAGNQPCDEVEHVLSQLS